MLGFLLSACAGDPDRFNYSPDYRSAIDSQGVASALTTADPAWPDGVKAFFEYFDNFTAATVAADTLDVYAADAYLNDTLKTLRGNEAIREYFVDTFENVQGLEAEVLDVSGSDRSWYFRWRMTLTFEDLASGKPLTSYGISHIVLNAQGRVAVHQDFWDSGTHLFTHVPIAGKIINKVKGDL